MREPEQLQESKTQLMQELYSNMKEEKEAILAANMERLAQLQARAAQVMNEIDAVDARLRELVGPVWEGQENSACLTDEQKRLILEMKELHKTMVSELIRQRTAVVEQLKELKETDQMIGMYKKGRSMEGMFLDQKK